MRRHVLVLTYADDAHAERLATELDKLDGRALLVPRGSILDWRFESDGERLSISGPNFPTQDARNFSAAFLRCLPRSTDFGAGDNKADLEPQEYIGVQRESLFFDWLHTLSLYIPFFNEVAPTARSSGKVFQRLLARRVGLQTPEEYSGDNPDHARAFAERIWASGFEVCTKAIAAKNLLLSGQRLTRYTEKLQRSQIDDLAYLSGCPLIFQNFLPKAYELRVTVVGDRILACRIDSQQAGGDTAIDWRNYNIPRTPHHQYELPANIAARLLEFHRVAGLRYSAFDFVRTTDGKYVFLETNAFGQWLWIEDLTGLPITATVAAELIASAS
jgi:glutathione synthase/RimK-type ligase-like ATP-grasp enzyme